MRKYVLSINDNIDIKTPPAVIMFLILILCAPVCKGVLSKCSVKEGDADCSSRGLTEIPTDLPRDITVLNLHDNAITVLHKDAFYNYLPSFYEYRSLLN